MRTLPVHHREIPMGWQGEGRSSRMDRAHAPFASPSMTLLPTEQLSFEDFSHRNGETYWYAREFMAMLGYASFASFRKTVMERAHNTCLRLQIPIGEHFREVTREVDGQEQVDFKLTRFACYLISMNGDTRKPAVAQAQGYFASLAEAARQELDAVEDVARVITRGEITDEERSLSAVAASQGVEHWPYFQNQGYMGLYNMSISGVRDRKGIPANRSPLDFMGSTELAANLFRITQTRDKIRNENIRGQVDLERAARGVGATVRKTMIELSGTRPEDLPPADDIKQVHRELKSTAKQFRQMDQLPAPRKGD